MWLPVRLSIHGMWQPQRFFEICPPSQILAKKILFPPFVVRGRRSRHWPWSTRKNGRLNRVEVKWNMDLFSALSCMVLSLESGSSISLALPASCSSIPRKAHLRYPTSSPTSPSWKIYPFYEPTGNPTTVSWSISLLTVGSSFIPWDLLCPSSRPVSFSLEICPFNERTENPAMTVS